MDLYEVRVFSQGRFCEIRTYGSYQKALDFANANLKNNWDIKQIKLSDRK